MRTWPKLVDQDIQIEKRYVHVWQKVILKDRLQIVFDLNNALYNAGKAAGGGKDNAPVLTAFNTLGEGDGAVVIPNSSLTPGQCCLLIVV